MPQLCSQAVFSLQWYLVYSLDPAMYNMCSAIPDVPAMSTVWFFTCVASLSSIFIRCNRLINTKNTAKMSTKKRTLLRYSTLKMAVDEGIDVCIKQKVTGYWRKVYWRDYIELCISLKKHLAFCYFSSFCMDAWYFLYSIKDKVDWQVRPKTLSYSVISFDLTQQSHRSEHE